MKAPNEMAVKSIVKKMLKCLDVLSLKSHFALLYDSIVVTKLRNQTLFRSLFRLDDNRALFLSPLSLLRTKCFPLGFVYIFFVFFFCQFFALSFSHPNKSPVTLMSNIQSNVGLLSLSGLIMFISIFKSEMYHKLSSEASPSSSSSSREPLFTFNYGHSFTLYVIGFVVVELSGILNVCLFNKLQKAAQQNQVSRQL